MATVADILAYLETLAPRNMKMDWDNVGLLCGRRDREVTRILVALDPFLHVCREAKELGAELLVTHHPLIFSPVKAVTDDTEVGTCIGYLWENGISAINAHTNLDCAPEGVNDILARRLGLSDIQVVDPMGTDEQGRPWGLLRIGQVEQMPLPEFLPIVKDRLDCSGLRYCDGGRPVSHVAVGGGACGSELRDAARAGCDTFVTSDVKYNQFRDAQYMGINLIDAGHFPTENPVVGLLAEKIAAAFPEIQVKISESHGDVTKFY
ncbi:MAG: Nif3-like dinuclear metal center hexameric protein [Oscillospiraceae bacterium]|nr:Nif3-like dinuclear metal center hexameric protein [Oscillospiraceae bacterium]